MLAGDSVLNLPGETRMLECVRAGLAAACNVRVAVAFTRCSGLALLMDPMREAIRGGANVQLLTSTYQCVTQPEALRILRDMPGVEARVQRGPVGLHAKCWWFEREQGGECWVGSSNLTKGGLATNLEWNLRRVDAETLGVTCRQFDALWSRPDVFPITDDWLSAYVQEYAAVTRMQTSPDVWESGPRLLVPNEAQREALRALRALRARGQTRAAVIAATGVGKTLLAAFDAKQMGAQSLLYVSHRLEHLQQARRAFTSVFPELRAGILTGDSHADDWQMVFATIQSLSRHREFLQRKIDYLIIDEFHHTEAPSYRVLRPVRDGAFLLGLTATPERQDGHDVLEWCDWNVAYEVRLPAAIDRGWLLPFHYFGIADETIDFAEFPWRRLDAIEDVLSIEARVELVLREALAHGFDGPKRATIGFCAGRRHAVYMADAFLRRGQPAIAVLGDQGIEDRERAYRRLSQPDDPLQWIFVSDVLNEGVDIPAINSVLFLRPTDSATLFLQQLGRGLRLCPGTEVLTVLDFVGHHRNAWAALNAIDTLEGSGRRVEVAPGVVVRPPSECEVVLQRRTREILAKVSRYGTRRAACEQAYRRVQEELGRPVLPLDLWERVDVPPLRDFRAAFGSWVGCQRACGDLPAWAGGLDDGHPVFAFLESIELDWQAQRVAPYALTWGLVAHPDNPAAGYEAFFLRWPMWASEQMPLANSATWEIVRKRLSLAPGSESLSTEVLTSMPPEQLLAEVEGRVLYTANADYQQRHGGVLRAASDLRLFARYSRPEVIRHFGEHYDPTCHNPGVLWFGSDGVIIAKLNTRTAKAQYQYQNRFQGRHTFCWTSQNKMGTDNESGRRVVEHERRALRLHLFVQPASHAPACYLGLVRVLSVEGSRPMQVTLQLAQDLPVDVEAYLLGS